MSGCSHTATLQEKRLLLKLLDFSHQKNNFGRWAGSKGCVFSFKNSSDIFFILTLHVPAAVQQLLGQLGLLPLV